MIQVGVFAVGIDFEGRDGPEGNSHDTFGSHPH